MTHKDMELIWRKSNKNAREEVDFNALVVSTKDNGCVQQKKQHCESCKIL